MKKLSPSIIITLWSENRIDLCDQDKKVLKSIKAKEIRGEILLNYSSGVSGADIIGVKRLKIIIHLNNISQEVSPPQKRQQL